MTRNAIMALVTILDDDLTRFTNRSKSLPTSLIVLVGLRFYATGSFQGYIVFIIPYNLKK